MDINKLASHLNGTPSARETHHSAGSAPVQGSKKEMGDTVSLDGYPFRKNELLYARSEYDKLTHTAFDQLKAMNAALTIHEKAKTESPEKAAGTPIGKVLDDPAVWEKIARKILE